MSPLSFVLSSSKAAANPTPELTSDTPGQSGEHPTCPQGIGELPALLCRPWRLTAFPPGVTWDSEKGPYQPHRASACLPDPSVLRAFDLPNSQGSLCQGDCGEVEALEAHKLRRPESQLAPIVL